MGASSLSRTMWDLSLQPTDSLVVAYGLSICPRGLSCPVASGILALRPGIRLMFPALQGWFLTIGTTREVPVLYFLTVYYFLLRGFQFDSHSCDDFFFPLALLFWADLSYFPPSTVLPWVLWILVSLICVFILNRHLLPYAFHIKHLVLGCSFYFLHVSVSSVTSLHTIYFPCCFPL